MSTTLFADIIPGLRDGSVVPYLGPGVLSDVVHGKNGEPMPADSDSLIYAMNNGKPMAPRLMYEFPRAAMNLELKRGRRFINQFLTRLYTDPAWSQATLHPLLACLNPFYIIDINRDTQLQQAYQSTPHTLIVGVARITASDYRFRLYDYDGTNHREIDQSEVNLALPILFKPLGTPHPEASFIASDADFVDYITELMGGFAIPPFLKTYRQGKRYLLLGLPLNRDTERMVLADIIYGAADPAGWALLPQPTPKEQRFCERLGIHIIQAELSTFIAQLKKALRGS